MDLHFATSQSGNPTLPDSKSCTVCGGAIHWRRRIARNWDEVMYCSASCRRASVANARTGSTERVEAFDHIVVDSVAGAA
jgi:hypothetical protein